MQTLQPRSQRPLGCTCSPHPASWWRADQPQQLLAEFPKPAEGSLSYFADGGQPESDGRAGILYLGADYRLSPAVLVGALVQFDDADQKLDQIGGRVRDQGWMVGPYTAVRLSFQNFDEVYNFNDFANLRPCSAD